MVALSGDADLHKQAVELLCKRTACAPAGGPLRPLEPPGRVSGGLGRPAPYTAKGYGRRTLYRIGNCERFVVGHQRRLRPILAPATGNMTTVIPPTLQLSAEAR